MEAEHTHDILNGIDHRSDSGAGRRPGPRGPLMAYFGSWAAEGTIPGRELEGYRDHP